MNPLRAIVALVLLSVEVGFAATPSSPSSLTATAVSSSQINLSWIDSSTSETGFSIERSLSSSTGFAVIATTGPDVAAFQNTGLASSTTYYYRVRATGRTGKRVTYSAYSNVASARTFASSTPPNAPTGLSAGAASSSQINLAWTDNSGNESGFKIERAASSTGPWSQIALTGSNATSYANTGLGAGSTYFYRVRAYNSGGDSAYSNTASATTLANVPNAPTNLSASAASSSRIDLVWSDNSGNESGFKIERAASSTGPWSQIATTSANATSYSSGGLSAATTYYYRVRAYNSGGDSAYSNTDSATTGIVLDSVAPSTPTGLGATPVSCSQINLSWSASTDSGGSGLKGYNVYRGTAFLKQVAAPGTSTTDTGLAGATIYTYTVSAVDNAGNESAKSAAASTNTPTCPEATWSKRFGSSGADFGRAVTVDTSGNRFIAGSFAGTADFGGGGLASAGGADLFVAKYSSSGVHLWSKRFGGATDDVAYAVAVDGSGNVVVAGYFQGSVSFGGTTLTSAGGYDIFVAKYSASGAHLWSKRFGSTSSDIAYAATFDGAGGVLLTGFFQGSVSFGGSTLSSTYGGMDTFVAKLSGTDGSHLWSKNFFTPSPDVGYAIAADTNGDVVVAGAFQGTANFGGGTLSSAGSYDAFLARYSSNGAHLWSKRFGSSSADYGYGVAVDGGGSVVLTGSFQGSTSFGGATLTSAGSPDIFVAKYSSTGAHTWSKRFGSSASDIGYAVAADGSNNVLLTGFFQGTVDFGGGGRTSAGYEDVFVAKLSSAGNHVWSRRFGGSSTEYGYGIAVEGAGNPTLTGFFYGTVDFGYGPLTSAGAQDVFLLNLNP